MGIVNISGGSDGKTIEIAKEIKNPKMQQIDYLSVNIEKAKQGISYMDEQLEKGYPIVVGVDHAYGNVYNTDKTTDHFVVIVGRGYDEKGLFYRFYEVGTGKANEEKYQWGTNDNNKLYMQSNSTLSGQTQMGNKKNYVVTQVRINQFN